MIQHISAAEAVELVRQAKKKEHENPRRGDTPSFHADGGRRDGTRYDGEDEPAASHGS